MTWTTKTVRVTDDCWLDLVTGVEPGERDVRYVLVGDDRHMNGMDSPATLRGIIDVMALSKALDIVATHLQGVTCPQCEGV
jgi:hypothetical protein